MSDHCHRNYVSDASEEFLAKRRAALDELTRISQEMGLYDEDFDNILIRVFTKGAAFRHSDSVKDVAKNKEQAKAYLLYMQEWGGL